MNTNQLETSLRAMVSLWDRVIESFPVLAGEVDYVAAKALLSSMDVEGVKTLPDDIKRGGDLSGTYLNGSLDCSYAQLVALLGDPGEGDGYKVDAEWTLTVRGTTLTIYNYKDGVNYNGKEEGTPTEDIRDWHIGGRGDIGAPLAYLASFIPNATFSTH